MGQSLFHLTANAALQGSMNTSRVRIGTFMPSNGQSPDDVIDGRIPIGSIERIQSSRVQNRSQPQSMGQSSFYLTAGAVSQESRNTSRIRRRNSTPSNVQSSDRTNNSIIDGRIPLRSRRKNVSRRWGCGLRLITCSKCEALMWLDEKTASSSKTNPEFSLCCRKGKVILPLLPPTPPELLDLHLNSAQFKEHIRTYNSMLSFTSMGGKVDHSVQDGRGPYSFKIHGENYHKIGTLIPAPGQRPKFAQLYIYDTEHEIRNRVEAMGRGRDGSRINESILEGLQRMLNVINPYVKIFRRARDMLRDNDAIDLRIRIIHSRDGRQYTQSTANEVAALIIGDGSQSQMNRDIVIQKLNGHLQRITETHPSYMPLQYPLLFPYGTDGWNFSIQFAPGAEISRDKISIREFYAFRLQHREVEGKAVLQGGRLLQQFVVDCYTAIEQQRLNYIRFNQDDLRTDLYQGLEDAVNVGDVDASAVGRRFVLPSSFTGGPRYMVQRYQDAMALCRVFGPPDLFITFTCNPNWPEIRDELLRIPGQRTEDRPDIVARVFRIKLRKMMDDFKNKKFFGKVNSDVHVVEFQKRGLPHSHITLTLADKITLPEEIDDIISAEIPDKDTDPLAFETVMRCMIHGPCGVHNPNAPCMVNGKCSKNYPKKFCEVTTIDENGHVVYRRRSTGRKYEVNGFIVTNEWVVPFNRDLCVMYDAHINVERCAHTNVIKYLYKYIHKGPDRATIVIEENVIQGNGDGVRQYRQADELKQYLDCRYISAIEACWRIFEFELQQQYPAVEQLQYHLPGEQFVVFRGSTTIANVLNRPRIAETMFTEWFQTNIHFPEANSLTYAEFPTSWVWQRGPRKWKKREKGVCIGRLNYAHPNAGERYYLRMLLTKVRGPKCFEDIRTVNGVVHPTFKSACLALGLLDDDNEWHEALTEASIWASGSQLRNLFTSMLMFSEVTDPVDLWEKHWENLTDDLQQRVQRQTGSDVVLDDEDLKNLGLLEIEHILNRNGRSLREFPPMPLPSRQSAQLVTNRLIREELDYDVADELQSFETLHAGLNDDQLRVYNSIWASYMKSGGLYFVYGSGGTGKTYLWKTLIAKFHSEKKIVLSVASSGIAALLLPGGKTAHSRFKIPINIDETSCCSINLGSDLAKLIQEASLIIWDEAPMMSRYLFEAVDRTFKDIMRVKEPQNIERVFGGKLFILGGDFRQILPIVTNGGREQTVASSLPNSTIWEHCRLMNLSTNMRLSAQGLSDVTRRQMHDFAEWIKLVGDGDIDGLSIGDGYEKDWIKISTDFLIKNDSRGVQHLIEATYPDMMNKYHDWNYLNERAILTPTNDDVDELNLMMLAMLPGDMKTFNSADKMCPTEDNGNEQEMHPPELLHSMNFPGLLNHCLQLKKGAPIMLLRNLNTSLGLCNGTRLIVDQMGTRVIRARAITGARAGEIFGIPRIVLSPTAAQSPFQIKRRQFPIRLAFAMTINKSQGQTLKNVGVYLRNPVFCHGQLYVALSRVTSPAGLKLLIVNKQGMPHDYTKNVVYKEIFSKIFN